MWRIPLSDLNYDNREAEAVQSVLASGWLTMGPRTTEFEAAFSKYHGVDHAVAVTNCTCALELTYRYILSQAKPGRRVIVVPDITFVATANAVIAAGGIPVLCDISSFNAPFLSVETLEKLLVERSDIAGVSIVHYAGIDSNAQRILEVCSKYNIALIEDCAHSAGATTDTGRPLGSIGFAGCFSFFSNKNIATGEGGMITTNETAFADWLRLARSHGVTASTWNRHISDNTSGYDVVVPGYNYRCTEITAALGLVQLEKLAPGNQMRRNLTHMYAELLEGRAGFKILLPDDADSQKAGYHILALICPDMATRNKVRSDLTAAGIQTSHHYPPVHTFSVYLSDDADAYPNAIAFADRELTLPLHPKLSHEHLHEITKIILGAA